MNIAVILAGGRGKRFGKQKLLELLHGRPVVSWSLETFSSHPEIDSIVFVVSKKHKRDLSEIGKSYGKVDHIVIGGDTRYTSGKLGVQSIPRLEKDDVILFHNGANPFVTFEEISEIIRSAKKEGSSGVGRKIHSTLRQISGKKSLVISRDDVYSMETPQAMKASIYSHGVLEWEKDHREPPTDDLQIAEAAGSTPKIVSVHFRNRKITTVEDLAFLERITNTPDMRIGIGEDSHEFGDKEKICRLCGIEVPSTPGFLGNSDGDVALHALSNAILSALGEGSFSRISDPLCRNGEKDSVVFLQHVLSLLHESSAVIENISLVFEGKRPKLEPHFPEMRSNLSEILSITEKRIGLTAHSGEDLSDHGRGKGMRVLASVLLRIWI